MRFYPADPDIATIFNRIEQGDIDLQPDFQRGEVWSTAKQQRLVDSILRNWIVPPILVVAAHDGVTQEVLDGQQRLAAIRDFKNNRIKVDGRIDPRNPDIQALHGLTYNQLPVDIKRAFDRTTIRIFEVRDYAPDEPAEIFFRLNQPTALTSAEKRNAFYGPVRSQIRDLVELLASEVRSLQVLSFTNTRMAYDDVIARLACTLEFGTLHKKVTASAITQMYRRQAPLDEKIYLRTKATIAKFNDILALGAGELHSPMAGVRLNKATALSWMLFICRLAPESQLGKVSDYLAHFELIRESLGTVGPSAQQSFQSSPLFSLPSRGAALLLYNDRASSRVADVSSVLIRDLVLWLGWKEFSRGTSIGSLEPAYYDLGKLERETRSVSALEHELLQFAEATKWGSSI